jgi:hypothetical protein
MEGVSESLKLGATYSQMKTSRVSVYPTTGNGSYYPTNVISVNLPSRSIIRLGSLSAYFNCNITGLTAHATDSTNAQIPYGHQLFSRVQFFVNNIPVNTSNYYDLLATALAKCTGSLDWAQTRVAQGALALVQLADDSNNADQRVLSANTAAAGATSKNQYMVLDDILGLPRCNGGGGVIDTGVFGDVRIEFSVNSAQCLKVIKNGNATDANMNAVSFNLSDFKVAVDVISSVSGAYLSMMEARLRDPRPLHLAFQNYQNSIQLNSNANRVGVSTNCLDIVLIAPLASGWETRATQAVTDLEAPRYSFISSRTLANASDTRLNFKIGSVQYPQAEIDNALQILDLTQNTFGHSDLQHKNLLCVGVSAATAGAHTFSRTNFLENNCIWAQALSSESEGWASKILAGVSTNQANSEITVSSSNFVGANGYVFVSCLYTSVLEYDPSSANIRVIA